MKRKLVIAPILVFTLLITSCSNADAKKAANAAQDISVSINLLIETKRDLLAQGTITNAQALAIDKALLELNIADRLFAQGVDKWSKGELNKSEVVKLFAAVNDAVKNLNDRGVLQITNEQARQTLSTITQGIAISLAIIQGVLGN